jgi:hypothetical protein
MSKKEVNSILLASKYFTLCKCEKPNCPKTEIARKYLTSKIRKNINSGYSFKSIYLLLIGFLFGN